MNIEKLSIDELARLLDLRYSIVASLAQGTIRMALEVEVEDNSGNTTMQVFTTTKLPGQAFRTHGVPR